MDFDLTDADGAKDAIKYLHQLHAEGKRISITEKHSPASNPQKGWINTLQTLYACERGEKLDDVKAQMSAECPFLRPKKAMTSDGTAVYFVPQIRDIDKPTASKFIEWIYHWAAARDCVLPSAEEFKANKEHFNKYIKQHKEFI